MKVNYSNKVKIDFRNGYCRISYLNNEKLLIYGESSIKELKRKGEICVIINQ